MMNLNFSIKNFIHNNKNRVRLKVNYFLTINFIQKLTYKLDYQTFKARIAKTDDPYVSESVDNFRKY